jgi:hypothetical protein
MFASSRPMPCPGFPVAVSFQDVDPEILAREDAHEAGRTARPGAGAWDTYLRRVLPALERNAAEDMAQALLSFGTSPQDSHDHADRMRRRALADGSASRARFWADVGTAIARVARL